MKTGNKRFQKKYLIWGAALVFLFIAVILPVLWPDASAGYSGIKKEVATYAVKNAWEVNSGINYATIAGTIRITAESVAPDDTNNKMCNGEFISSTEPSAGNHFLVTVNYRTIFGISRGSDTLHICRDLHPSS